MLLGKDIANVEWVVYDLQKIPQPWPHDYWMASRAISMEYAHRIVEFLMPVLVDGKREDKAEDRAELAERRGIIRDLNIYPFRDSWQNNLLPYEEVKELFSVAADLLEDYWDLKNEARG